MVDDEPLGPVPDVLATVELLLVPLVDEPDTVELLVEERTVVVDAPDGVLCPPENADIQID